MRTVLLHCALALLASLCCTAPVAPPGALAPDPPPLPRGRVRVEGMRTLGPYLEAQLVGNAGRQGFLFVPSESCRAVLATGSLVRIEATPPLMTVVGAKGTRCTARGISGLAGWRDSLPQRRSSLLVLTEPAELALVAEAPDYLIASGSLPLALELRWSKAMDVAVVLPNTPACRAHLARGRTEHEFRARGDDALVLRGRLEPCPIRALAEPVLLN
ncbi:MAG: hypothetical protein FJ091_20725 [Deltaproteobacteria bacterium]|nr:hypothetical protein [Deltaproteobacteria bacterium]